MIVLPDLTTDPANWDVDAFWKSLEGEPTNHEAERMADDLLAAVLDGLV